MRITDHATSLCLPSLVRLFESCHTATRQPVRATLESCKSRLERHARQELSVRSQLHKLCLKCEQIQFPPSEGPYRSNEVTYFKSMALLESSASSGCHLCTLMVHGLARSLTRSSSLYDQPYGVIRVCHGPENSEPEVQIEYGALKQLWFLETSLVNSRPYETTRRFFILRSLRTLIARSGSQKFILGSHEYGRLEPDDTEEVRRSSSEIVPLQSNPLNDRPFIPHLSCIQRCSKSIPERYGGAWGRLQAVT